MNNKEIELVALLTEREGMLAANLDRVHSGEGVAYHESDFTILATKIRALKSNDMSDTAC
jgi:hypothetical protein